MLPTQTHSVADNVQVDPSKVETQTVQDDGQNSHAHAKDDNDSTRHQQNLWSSGILVDVFTVNVVRHQGRNGDRLGRSGGHNGHEQHDEDQCRTSVTQQVCGDGRRHQSGSGFAASDGKHESRRGKSERGGERERNGEPANSAIVGDDR